MPPLRFFDIDGNEITKAEYVELFHDQDYRRLARTIVHKRWRVTTIWVGFNLAQRGKSLYFETVIEPVDDPEAMRSIAKYPTKSAALTGHRKIVKDLRAGRKF